MKKFTLESFENYYARVGESFLEEEHLFPFSIKFYIGYLLGKYPEKGVKIIEYWDEQYKERVKSNIPFRGISFCDLVDDAEIFPATDKDELFNFNEFYSTFVELANSCKKFNDGFVSIFQENGVETE